MKNTLLSIIVLAGLLFAGLAQAGVSSLLVMVDGMSCPFCAFGVEKRLKKVGGVASVVVDMKSGIATLSSRPGTAIRFQDVPKAVKEAGFTAGSMDITICGVVEGKGGGRFVLRDEGLALPLRVDNNDINAQLAGLVGSSRSIVLTGPLSFKGKNDWSLAPATITQVVPQ